ncbi:MAG TPA: ATP-binding protein [Thermoanaerobaculia bacterium]|nr:ATP-binding protein [Thermoanaerobaculia bacterium]
MEAPSPLWLEANHQYLLAAVDGVRAALEAHAAHLAGRPAEDRGAAAAAALQRAAAALPAPAALERLTSIFGLSPFERGVILLGAGLEVDAAFGSLCAAAHGDGQRDYPTFRLALDALPGSHWSALSPDGSLRRWRLLELGPANALSASPLRLAERVLHYLFGVHHLDDRLAGVLETVPPPRELAPGQRALAERIAALWQPVRDAATFPVVELTGGDPADRRAIAAWACTLLSRDLQALPAPLLPTRPDELESLRRLWELEGALSRAALLIEHDETREAEAAREEAVAWLSGRALGGVLVSGDARRRARHRPVVTFEVAPPSTAEQRALWKAALDGAGDANLNGRIDHIPMQFHLGAPAIRTAAIDAMARLRAAEAAGENGHGKNGDDLFRAVWDACRTQARPRLDDLAERILPAATADDLILPDHQKQVLVTIGVQVRRRLEVYEHWGFDSRGERGLGISALFAGPSGTGKTMAAEVLARELRLDLYRIDLSATVSKYIGETEKNLKKIFDAAEAGGVILLFDEADALFGKRSDVKDSHDRHANIEVSYLLQRMEAYRGLAILTTNLKRSLDTAFLRRIRFIVEFPFPGHRERAEIWRRAFPATTPTAGLDPEKLAQLNVSGGNIRNIALNAAFLAADAGEPVRMAHLLRAARSEYTKLEKTLGPGEVRGWDESR